MLSNRLFSRDGNVSHTYMIAISHLGLFRLRNLILIYFKLNVNSHMRLVVTLLDSAVVADMSQRD